MDSRTETMTVLPRSQLTTTALDELVRFIAGRNREPSQHIGYLGEESDAVAAELRELDGDPVFAVARAGPGDRSPVCGLLCADWDLKIGRAWLHGPWARRLYERGGFRLLRQMRSFRIDETRIGAGA